MLGTAGVVVNPTAGARFTVAVGCNSLLVTLPLVGGSAALVRLGELQHTGGLTFSSTQGQVTLLNWITRLDRAAESANELSGSTSALVVVDGRSQGRVTVFRTGVRSATGSGPNFRRPALAGQFSGMTFALTEEGATVLKQALRTEAFCTGEIGEGGTLFAAEAQAGSRVE